MSGTFLPGEEKIRPGVYQRYENADPPLAVNAMDGIGAAVVQSNWGPVGEAVTITASEKDNHALGKGGTTGIITEMFAGGCNTVKAVRLGTGGKAATLAIEDGDNAELLRLSAKYPGDFALAVTIRDSLVNPELRECIIYSGGQELEKYYFAKGKADISEGAALLLALESSEYIRAEKIAEDIETLPALQQAELTGGENPAVTTADYSDALALLEATYWYALAVDTLDAAVHALVKAYMERLETEGYNAVVCIAEAPTVPLDARIANAAAYNHPRIVYLLNNAVDAQGQAMDKVLTAARIAGMIAATPSNQSLTHQIIGDWGGLSEPLANAEIENALMNGCMVLSLNASNQVWVESGVNTLVKPHENQDAGWKKIKRCKVRDEIMRRIGISTEGLIGKVDNDQNGQATIVAAAKGVLNDMAGEKKILAGGTVMIDPSSPPIGDSVWLIISADDMDAIEKLYITYRFRFAPTN